METNLRHLRAFLATVEHSSVTRAAEHCRLSQPAVTQAISKLEADFAAPLFERTTRGILATRIGKVFAGRVERALAHLDEAFAAIGPRLRVTASAGQLRCFVAVRDTGNFTLAARRLGVAQPTVHRAVSGLEKEALRPLLERTSAGIVATRAGQNLAAATRLAFAELDQAGMEVAELLGRQAGGIVIGAMPLSRVFPLPQAIARFRERWPRLALRIVDGPYDELVAGLRGGEIDFLVGALREPPPIADIEQSLLFEDRLEIVARPDHPLAGRNGVSAKELRRFPWVVAARGTPARAHFDRLFAAGGGHGPHSIVESGSFVFMRELLAISDHLGCVSRLQARAEIHAGRLAGIDFPLAATSRAIGITTRRGWQPTASQRELLELMREARGGGV